MTFRLFVGLLVATSLCLPLAACGKKGPNQAPGPQNKITYPRIYPPE
ncbi:hypothetical protein [Acetobacter syzygii]|nr:hypothetical protein [Acetobacter syzygii]NSL92157.1 hypothetical protein [Acetobacter syzygii]GAN70203.1 hypothetical protein Absy_005_031 [Acetobacter syzygii]GBR63028.1 hypothetical protein AA0483_0668 [Acetobacter syzygii NRIC 0483]GEL55967.1 hypothetical protein ASY01nite_10330 [Acetobacter syzygii]